MAEFTENYSLIKPNEADYYDVQDFNENMDTIDSVMAAAENTTNSIDSKIGTAGDTGSTTVFGKLNALGSGSGGNSLKSIKSIQHVTVGLSTNNGSATGTINTVVPENCIVLMDRFYDGTNMKSPMSYTLHADHIEVVTTGATVSSITLHFQIIEFC